MTAAYAFSAVVDDEPVYALGMTLQPVLGPAVLGDACDIRVGRQICGSEVGVREAVDADGRTRILCSLHVAKYFPKS